MAIAAAKAGKDIWCEKPMSRTIGEGIAMVKAGGKHERMFRINTWFRFQAGFYGMRVPVSDAQESGHERPARLAAQGHRFRRTGFDWKLHLVRQNRTSPATGAAGA
jgi:myo-inositol 2-dehydrogenase / D-chiro-inositol 1-dehydrogenase